MSEHPGERLSEEERKAVLFELSEDDHLTRPGRDFDHYERLLARAIAKLERSASVSPSDAERQLNTMERLAKAAFALQELRYLAWQALKRWDDMTLRKAQRAGAAGEAMEALRAALPRS